MASGKSTLLNALRARVDIIDIDLDSAIEQQEGCRVSRIFELHGEARFRSLEREMLGRIPDIAGRAAKTVVVACGGGTPCQEGNMELMNALGTTVWLEASLPVLAARLREGKATRPLLASVPDSGIPEVISSLLDSRKKHYEKARFRFDSSRLDSEREVEETVNEFINRFL